MLFVQMFNNLLNERNITPYRMGKDTGIADRMIGYWKDGERVPSVENLLKVAEYFDVTTDYLLTGAKQQGELSKEETEIVRIYNALDFKQRIKFLNYAIELDEANNNKPVPDKKLVYRAARSSNNAEPKMIEMSQEEIDKIRNASDVTEI